ncbi:MAG: cob(I)yrinic acid a,c-diamide adenosyltransferase [bacterium]|nr:cob(I)yrinic acid a,c-diamide adenosyltransferase [bacterium]
MNERGYIHIYTGDGKGKTTAGLGLCIRAMGAGKRCGIIYFDKGGTHYSERGVLDQFKGKIDYFACGLDRIDPITNEFRFGVTEDDKREGEKGLVKAWEWMRSGIYDVLVLDEINTTTTYRMVNEDDVLKLIDAKPAALELVLTGRHAPESFRIRAHLVTEMTLVKHYFYDDVKAREGIDF